MNVADIMKALNVGIVEATAMKAALDTCERERTHVQMKMELAYTRHLLEPYREDSEEVDEYLRDGVKIQDRAISRIQQLETEVAVLNAKNHKLAKSLAT